MDNLKKIKYKLIDNFLKEDELKLLQKYCDIRHYENKTNFDFKQNKNGDTCYYSDPLMESLMINKRKLMEKETNLLLYPTYSFWRMYTFGADLKKHQDRPSCEISVTVQINGDSDWPIFMGGKEVVLKNGQAVAYCGIEIEHWREELKGDFQAQAFLHYVDKDGPHAEWAFDKRKNLGEQ